MISALPDVSDAAPRPATSTPDRPTRELSPAALAGARPTAPQSSAPPPPPPRPPAAPATIPPLSADDFDDEYTAVGDDDVFDQIRDLVANQGDDDPREAAFEAVDELHTGDIQLIDELDSEVQELDSMEVIADVDELSGVEELDDAIEEFEELEELAAAPPVRSIPPPPPGSSPPPRND